MKFNEGDRVLVGKKLYTVDHTSDLGMSLKGLGWIGVYTQTYEDATKFNGKHKWYRVIKEVFGNDMYSKGAIRFASKSLLPAFENLFENGNIENWSPKNGELCWFWSKGQLDNDGSAHFGKYGISSYTEEFYDFIEPFTCKIPEFMKKEAK